MNALQGVKVGDVIAVSQASYRNNGERELFNSAVTKVGRKYVEAVKVGADPFFAMRFEIADGCGKDCYPSARAWASVEDRDNSMRVDALRNDAIRLMGRGNQLRALDESELLRLIALLSKKEYA